jgi:tetratricopeptide (TPR) repeat protein
MGAGVSTEGAPLSEVAIKNEIGVLYDAEKKKAFDAAATEGPDGTRVAAWPTIEAHAKQHDERALDPRKCMYVNLKAFKAAREQIDEIASVHIKGDVKKIPWVGKNLGDECRQCGLDGEPAASLDALYEVAALARVQFEEIMTAACPESGVKLMFAPLKGRDRAGAKARDEYKDKTAPCYSWLFDITRGAALCQTEDAIVQLYAALEADDRVDIVRTKNRFAPPLFNGYQDILMNVAVKVENVSHLCELQIHLMPIKESEALHQSHTVYEYFRSFFLGNSDAVAQRLEMLCKLPVDEANDVEELVDHVLGSDADANLLEGLCELLTSIQEFAGVVKVREAILAYVERASGAESKEAGKALAKLGNAYFDLGDHAKARDAVERALPIYERAYGIDHAEVAEVLDDLGAAYGKLGDYAKERDVMERALAIKERAYGRDHPNVAITLTNLGIAYGQLGDYAKMRDVLERSLAIEERAYGRDHLEVANTLTNLGNAYGELGDQAKERDMLERALAIQERAYGRDHPDVAQTLMNLGNAYGDLGDQAKKRDMLERALAIFERAYGRDHPSVAFPLANLGNLCLAYGVESATQVAKAREYFDRAHAIFERAYGPGHQVTQQVRAWLASVS